MNTPSDTKPLISAAELEIVEFRRDQAFGQLAMTYGVAAKVQSLWSTPIIFAAQQMHAQSYLEKKNE